MVPPIVKRLSTLPEFRALQAKVAALPTLAAKLEFLGARKGFVRDGPVTLAQRCRATLATMALEDAFAGAAWADAAHDSRDAGTVAAQVIMAALRGAADTTLLPGVVTGATIADAVQTDMTLRQALAMLARADAAAVDVVREGATVAAAEHGAAYRDHVVAAFKREFAKGLNPFTNPLTEGAAKVAAALLAGFVVYKVTR